MNAQIESSQVLTMAKQRLRITNSDQENFLSGLIQEGARRLGTVETLIIKNCTVEANDNRFYLPSTAKKLIAFRSKDSCIPGIFIDIPFFTACGCNNLGAFTSLINIADINGRWVNLINTVPDGTEIDIAFQQVNVDENGEIIINEEQEIVLIAYSCYQFALAYNELYTAEQRKYWYDEYNTQANRSRSLAARRKYEQQKKQIQQVMFRMVNNTYPFSALSGSYSVLYPTITSI